MRTEDRGYRWTTAACAAAIVLVVAAIGFELSRQSLLSVEKFGFGFWKGKT